MVKSRAVPGLFRSALVNGNTTERFYSVYLTESGTEFVLMMLASTL